MFTLETLKWQDVPIELHGSWW